MQIELAKTVAAQPSAAFATVANVTDWPRIITSIRRVELLTPGPIRLGTRLREHRIMFGRDSVQVMEVATIERPHRFRLVVEHPDLHYELDHLIDAVHGGGCRVMVIFRSRPETPVGRALHPFMTPFMEQPRASAALVNAQHELGLRKRRVRDAGDDPESDHLAAGWREDIRRLRAVIAAD